VHVTRSNHTHSVAVGGIIIDDSKILLLLRNTPPKVWAPPGGRLNPREAPDVGLSREIREECGIEAKPIMPVSIWSGVHEGTSTVAIFYLCSFLEGPISLSPEHTDYMWCSTENLRTLKKNNMLFGELYDYSLAIALSRFINTPLYLEVAQ
jgi:ADP-ribose pyrophosphatase YjhB (NUDIX family)